MAEIPPWLDLIEDEIALYQSAIDEKWDGSGDRSKDGAYPGLSVDESIFADMWFFWQGCLINSGDVSGNLGFMEQHLDDFAVLNATGCLKAVEAMRSRVTSEAEELAYEDDFPSLLLAFARHRLPPPA